MSSLFGCVVPGCPVITTFTQVSETKWMTPLGNAPESLVVFLTGAELLPDGFGLAVYISQLDSDLYEYVGHLTNDCPSSIFKVPSSFLHIAVSTPIGVGVSLEPLTEIANLGVSQHQPMEQRRAATYLQIASRIAADFVTFVSSFGRTLSNDPSDPQSEEIVYLPLSYVSRWKARLDAKICKDTSFWNQLD